MACLLCQTREEKNMSGVSRGGRDSWPSPARRSSTWNTSYSATRVWSVARDRFSGWGELFPGLLESLRDGQPHSHDRWGLSEQSSSAGWPLSLRALATSPLFRLVSGCAVGDAWTSQTQTSKCMPILEKKKQQRWLPGQFVVFLLPLR